jgi:hypothetical protein
MVNSKWRIAVSEFALRAQLLRPLHSSVHKRSFSLSLGERVDRDGAFTSRRGPGEGSLSLPG